jgi:hypothetical protein
MDKLLDAIIDVSVLITITMLLRVIIQSCGQHWIKTTAHTATLTLLPILTYVITQVISGNIALSLGMVGALSIVRFRHPVRSPLELSVYFGAITMGIAASVSLKWLLFLFGSILMVVAALIIINFISKALFKKEFLSASFSEGNSLSTLSIKSKVSINSFDTFNSLISKKLTSEESQYVFASNDINELKEIEKNIEIDDNVLSIQLTK